MNSVFCSTPSGSLLATAHNNCAPPASANLLRKSYGGEASYGRRSSLSTVSTLAHARNLKTDLVFSNNRLQLFFTTTRVGFTGYGFPLMLCRFWCTPCGLAYTKSGGWFTQTNNWYILIQPWYTKRQFPFTKTQSRLTGSRFWYTKSGFGLTENHFMSIIRQKVSKTPTILQTGMEERQHKITNFLFSNPLNLKIWLGA